MSNETLKTPSELLVDVRDQRRKIAEEDKRLVHVEQYLANVVAQFNASVAANLPAVGNGPINRERLPVVAVPIQDGPPIPQHPATPIDFSGITRHSACEMALRALGGQQRTGDIARWLLEKGYPTTMDERVFYNSCYTSMMRKKDTFRRVRSKWELIEKPSNP